MERVSDGQQMDWSVILLSAVLLTHTANCQTLGLHISRRKRSERDAAANSGNEDLLMVDNYRAA